MLNKIKYAIANTKNGEYLKNIDKFTYEIEYTKNMYDCLLFDNTQDLLNYLEEKSITLENTEIKTLIY